MDIMSCDGKNTGANEAGERAALYNIGDMVHFPAESDDDPKWDFGIIVETLKTKEDTYYVVYWAADLAYTTEDEDWLVYNTRVVNKASKK